jgi:hypothetical protein
MVSSLITSELVKLAIQKLAEVKPEDVARALKSLERATTGRLGFVPRLGGFGAGVALGVGVGLLFAPRAGKEMREAITEAVRQRLQSLQNRKAGTGEPTAASTPPVEPQGPEAATGGGQTASGNGAASGSS